MKRIQCDICGTTEIKKIGDDLYQCVNCGVQYTAEDLKKLLKEIPTPQESPQSAPVQAPAAPSAPAWQAPQPQPYTPNAPMAPVAAPITEDSYKAVLANCGIYMIASVLLLAASVIFKLLAHNWISSSWVVSGVLCFVAEIITLYPHSRVKKLCKRQFLHIADNKERTLKTKAVIQALRDANPLYRMSYRLGIVAFLCLCIVLL